MTRINQAHRVAHSGLNAKAGVGPVGEHTLLKRGSDGNEVKQLQRQLVAHGFLEKATGQFDADTDKAVRAYQASKGLKVDGLVGQQTWGSFNGESHPPGTWLLHKPTGGYPGNSNFDPKPSSPGSNTPVGNVDLSPVTHGSNAEKILETARQFIGTHEGAGNRNPFSSALGRPPEAWCADFVSYAAKKAGLTLNTASAQGVQDYLQKHGTWKGKHNPQPGDALTFAWNGHGGWADHVGMVEKVYQRNGQIYIDTIEGNSSDQVRRKTYAMNDPAIKGFGTIV